LSKNKKKTLRKKYRNLGDLNGKALAFPFLTFPSKEILHWAAQSAYTAALKSSRPHECAIASEPSEAEWKAIAEDVSPNLSVRLRAFVDAKDFASEEEEDINEAEES
jgi:hypothetical protein